MTLNPLRVLLVEDDEDDYLLTRDLLAEIAGMAHTLDWARSYEAALEAIGNRAHDVYLLDYRLGGRSGVELIRAITSEGSTTPGILLTGEGAYQVDVEAMEAGAADYLIKSELTPALLERAIRHACERARLSRLRDMARVDLQHFELRFRTMIESSFDGIVLLGPAGDVRYASPAMRTILGYENDEFVGTLLTTMVHAEDRETIVSTQQTLRDRRAGMAHLEVRVRHFNGQYRWLEVVATSMLQDSNVGAIVLNIRDSTERKWADEEYAQLLELEQTTRARAEQAEANLGAVVAGSPFAVKAEHELGAK